jgi:hypothetical protein
MGFYPEIHLTTTWHEILGTAFQMLHHDFKRCPLKTQHMRPIVN